MAVLRDPAAGLEDPLLRYKVTLHYRNRYKVTVLTKMTAIGDNDVCNENLGEMHLKQGGDR